MVGLLVYYLSAEGASFALAALGVFVAFVWLRFPDLSPDGSFLVGAGAYAAAANAGVPPSAALLVAACGGGAVGLFTALISERLRVPPLIAGVIATLLAYSTTWQIMGKPNVFLPPERTLFGGTATAGGAAAFAATSLILAGAAGFVCWRASRTWWGLRLRALGENPSLARELGASYLSYLAGGLALSNCFVAVAGALFVQRSYAADVNMGAGTTVTGLIAVLLGALVSASRPGVGQQLGATIGAAIAYKLLFFLLLRLGVPAELFRGLSGAVLIGLFVLARSRSVIAGVRWT